MASAYQNAFLYIRQLALLLRKSIQDQAKDSGKAIRRWQVGSRSRAHITRVALLISLGSRWLVNAPTHSRFGDA